MENAVSVTLNRTSIGSITVEESPKELKAQRTAGGFALDLPITVRLGMIRGAPQPMLSNISASLYLGTDRIGEARCEGHLFFGGEGGDAADTPGAPAALVWIDTLSALAYFEQLRTENPPQLRMELRAEVCRLLRGNGEQTRSAPESVFGTARATYSLQVWAKMLRALGIIDYVFVEIPLPSDPPTGWDGVWRELRRARDARDIGGDTGWTGCVVAVRRALEAWEKIEPEMEWPKTREGREALTKKNRLACKRSSLHLAAHPAAHLGDDEWSREEAQFMLASLCGLLAERRPRTIA